MSQRSTAAAHERPSAMAQTMRLCPRVWSPHTKTPSTLVAQSASAATVPRGSDLHAELGHRVATFRADEAHGQQHEVALELELGAGDLLEDRAAVLGRASRPRGPRRARTRPEPLSTNSVVVTEKRRSPPSSWAEEVRRMSGHSGQGLSASPVARGARP